MTRLARFKDGKQTNRAARLVPWPSARMPPPSSSMGVRRRGRVSASHPQARALNQTRPRRSHKDVRALSQGWQLGRAAVRPRCSKPPQVGAFAQRLH
eukprot:4847748-Alexandrium_andersonii.AAC.1